MKGSSCWGSVILCRVRGIRGGGVWGNNRVASEIETGGPKSGGSNKSFLVRVCFFLAWREVGVVGNKTQGQRQALRIL